MLVNQDDTLVKLDDKLLDSIMYSPDYNGYIFKHRECHNPETIAQWKTYEQRVAASQIPEDTLKILSTEGLAWSNIFCILNPDYRAYGTLEVTEIHGVDQITDLSNGWVKLSKQIDGAAYLLKIWKNMEIPEDGGSSYSFSTMEPKEKCKIVDQGLIPLILSLDKFNWSLSNHALKAMAEIAFEKISKQIQYPDTYSYGSIKYNYVALASIALKIADLSSEEKNELQYYIHMSGTINEPDVQHFIELIQNAVVSAL